MENGEGGWSGQTWRHALVEEEAEQEARSKENACKENAFSSSIPNPDLHPLEMNCLYRLSPCAVLAPSGWSALQPIRAVATHQPPLPQTHVPSHVSTHTSASARTHTALLCLSYELHRKMS